MLDSLVRVSRRVRQPDSKEIASYKPSMAMGLALPLWGNSPGQGDLLAESVYRHAHCPKRHISPTPWRAWDSEALGFSPVTRRY
ncbi:hypothetical protein JTE90_000959 [Oedothorax gibbosus]|uniref:Uncharacterized protein n=1 Tax=Oedothorax gibbosus TaxID=931172 RepID=A0AAV6TJY3_9ARAC|nr:hypothetical protein JTE90_000959 [Oedothorax gibbosus]